MAKKKGKWKKWVVIGIIAAILIAGYIYINKATGQAMAQYAKSAIIEEEVKLDVIESKTSREPEL